MRKAFLVTTLLCVAGAARAEVGPGGASLTDCHGNSWWVSAAGAILEGSNVIPGSGGTSSLSIQGCDVYGKDDGHGPVNPGGWFLLTGGQYWMPAAAPAGVSASAPTATAANAPTTTQAAVAPVAQAPVVPTLSTAPAAQQQCATSATGVGGFHVAGGQIIGPDGKPWVARGINVYGDSAGSANPGAITATFTGLNFARYIVRSLNDPGSFDAFVNAMTSQGRVVEFEDHPDGGGDVDAGPPQGIVAESAWYAAMASHFKGNPYVWFGTFNEPMPTSGLSAWQQATYNAIRGTGSNAMLMVEVSGSRPSNLQQALNPSVYATMTNIVWDVHVYPYQNDYSTDETSIADNINGMIAAAQKITSADGLVPVIIGESGPSTTGEGLDPNGYETVQGLITIAASGTMGGLAPFTYYPGFDSPNDLTDSSGNVTSPYGQMAQIFINMNVVPQSACQQNADAQQAIAAASASLQAPQ